MASQGEIQELITQRIIEALEQGVVPWRKPWTADANAGIPTNVTSRQHYRGINPILLDLAAMQHGFMSRWWGTYDQWRAIGGQVKRRPEGVPAGRWGTSIVFWKEIPKKKVDDEDDAETFAVLRWYTVFNLDQVEGTKIDRLRATQSQDAEPSLPDFAKAEQAVSATGARIQYGGNQAYYLKPGAIGEGDYIVMPHRRQFPQPQDFFATLFHELVHWSECRLNWSGSYALGELVAEMGGCLLCSQTEVPCSDDLSRHASYVDSWLKALNNDRRFIFQAASQAAKAADFVMNFSRRLVPVEA